MSLDAKTTPRYWASYLDATIEAVFDMLMEPEEYGRREVTAKRHLYRAIEEYRTSGVAIGFVGYVVECQKKEAYALVRTLAEATTARRHAVRYLDSAIESGHPAAPGWVNERLPMTVRPVLADEWARIKHDIPVLDREP
jgi:hypothetical protein